MTIVHSTGVFQGFIAISYMEKNTCPYFNNSEGNVIPLPSHIYTPHTYYTILFHSVCHQFISVCIYTFLVVWVRILCYQLQAVEFLQDEIYVSFHCYLSCWYWSYWVPYCFHSSAACIAISEPVGTNCYSLLHCYSGYCW